MAAAMPSRALISSKCGCSGSRHAPQQTARRPRGTKRNERTRTDVHAARRAGCVGGR
jgi:hypothetical protein